MVRVVITFIFALMVSVASEVGSAAAKNWNTGSSNQPSKQNQPNQPPCSYQYDCSYEWVTQ